MGSICPGDKYPRGDDWVCPGVEYSRRGVGGYSQGMRIPEGMWVPTLDMELTRMAGTYPQTWDPSQLLTKMDTVGKWVVYILLECFIVPDFSSSLGSLLNKSLVFDLELEVKLKGHFFKNPLKDFGS